MEERFMRLALIEAKRAAKIGEVPIGAVIVRGGEVIAKAHNKREKLKLATAHAEILAINKACKKLGDWRLEGCEMYVTLEPCAMCAGAILNSRIESVYFGAYEKKGGAVESRLRLLDGCGLNWSAKCEGGILIDECSAIISDFFKNRR